MNRTTKVRLVVLLAFLAGLAQGLVPLLPMEWRGWVIGLSVGVMAVLGLMVAWVAEEA